MELVEPQGAVKLLNNLSAYLIRTSDLDGALATCQRGVQVIEEAFGPESSELVSELTNMGSVLEDKEELRELKVEMIDRFGLLPDAVKNLFAITELKQQATLMGIKRIDIGDSSGDGYRCFD